MTNSQGGLSLPGTKCRSNLKSEFAEGKGKKLARQNFYHGVYCIINNVVRVEALAHKVVEERAASDEASSK